MNFHFALPTASLLARVKGSRALILGCSTTVEETLFLEAKGCDVIIAQGYEAGGHLDMFITDSTASQSDTFSLLPQTVDAINIAVIAAEGIADGKGVAAAMLQSAEVV